METREAAAAAAAADWKMGLLLVGVVHRPRGLLRGGCDVIPSLSPGKHVRGPYYVIKSRDIADGPPSCRSTSSVPAPTFRRAVSGSSNVGPMVFRNSLK